MSEKKQTVNVGDVKLSENGFVSVIAQDYESGEVLLLSKMNAEALEKTFETGYAHYYCDKKKAVVKYGATLGNTQKLKVAFVDENGTLLIKVRQTGKAAPEMGSFSRFSKQIKGEYKDIGGEMFGRLQRIVEEYKNNKEGILFETADEHIKAEEKIMNEKKKTADLNAFFASSFENSVRISDKILLFIISSK